MAQPPPQNWGKLDAGSPHTVNGTPREDTPGTDADVNDRPRRGRPKLSEAERLSRQRARNKTAAHHSRQRRNEQEAETRQLLDIKTRECKELEDRCHELEAQVRELQATLQARGLPLPSVPGPSRTRRSYWPQPEQPAPYMLQQQQYPMPPYAGGLEALANAALPNLQAPPVPAPHGMTPMNASALGDLQTPLHTATPVAPMPMNPDLAAALEGFDFSAYNWRPYDDDAMSLSALFTLDDLGEDANDADFVPPTSPKGESSDSESEDEAEAEGRGHGKDGTSGRPHKRRRVEEERATHTPETPDDEEQEAEDEPEDLFLPIEDVPVPEDQLYADAMTALGVSTPAELAVVVSKIVETASRGGVTSEQVEGLRRLMRLAEARGAAISSGSGAGGSSVAGRGGSEGGRRGTGRTRE